MLRLVRPSWLNPRPVLPQPRTLRVTPASALNSQGPSRPCDGPSSLRSSGVTSFGSCPQVPCPPPPSDHTGTAHYWADPGGQVKAAHGGGSGVPPAPVGFWVSWARPPALALPQESFTSGRVSEPPRDLDRGRVLSLEHLQRTEAAVHPLAAQTVKVQKYRG